MTRTVFYQKFNEKQRVVYELVRRANEAVIAEIRPEIPLSRIDHVARSIIEQGGIWPLLYFTHRLGHGCGLDCHEPPDVSAASTALLRTRDDFSVEPGIYRPGEFGVRIEDLVLVTEHGCDVLNNHTKDLLVVG